ncbi:MAG: DUF3108 domain-containing protein [Deltaproteobacteria bacterium]|nr:DUF3108 domain-containing protein [Deltaproteobacteria bacterium]
MMKLSRRKFIVQMALFAGWLLRPRLSFPSGSQFFGAPLAPPGGEAGEVALKNIDFFLKENVNYDINFLWFSKAAVGKLNFSREGPGFKAILEAETKGFIGFLTFYRKHSYISHMSYLPDSRQLRVDFFERHVKVGSNEEKTYTWTDYNRRVLRREEYKKGKKIEDVKELIPEGVIYEDILSAFYNVRLGYYGPIRRGRQFTVRSLPSDGVSTIEVSFTTKEDAIKSRDLFGNKFDENMFSARVKVPRDLFKSKTGEVSILFDDALVPVYGVVKDYIGFGDIMGILKREGEVVQAHSQRLIGKDG